MNSDFEKRLKSGEFWKKWRKRIGELEKIWSLLVEFDRKND